MPLTLPTSNYPYVLAVLILWFAWGASWLIAALWRSKRVSGALGGSYRPQLAVAALGFFGMFAEHPAVAHPLWLVPAWLGCAMVLFVAAGLAFAWWARIHLGVLWSGGIVRREGHRIVDSGPYAIVRHPIYTALIMGAAGLAAVKATPLAVIGAALVGIGFALKAKVEERFLAAELGEQVYADYRRRVPMLIPLAPTAR